MKRHAIWLFARDLSGVDIKDLKKKNVTDIFVSFVALTSSTYRDTTTKFLKECKEEGIKVSLWTQALYIGGTWFNPTTNTGKERIRVYLEEVREWIQVDGIEGIHVDYIRFPGNAGRSLGSTEAITGLMKDVYEIVKAAKPNALVSAAVMPEGAINSKYYGQDYEQLGQYNDVLCPMTYTGNYRAGPTWLRSQVKYIVENSDAAVWAGLQTYLSDDNVVRKTKEQLLPEVKAAGEGGAEGIIHFRYGLIDEDAFVAAGKMITPEEVPDEPTPPAEPEAPVEVKTIAQVVDAAQRCTKFIQDNQRMPNYVTVGGDQTDLNTYNRMILATVLEINSGEMRNILHKKIDEAADPVASLKDGELNKEDYIDAAQRTYDFMMERETAPNFTRTPLGSMSPDNLTDMYSRILNFYGDRDRLPAFVYTNSIASPQGPPSSSVPSSVSAYLEATRNCQVNHATIRNLANQLKTPRAIFNWVRDRLGYEFYYNSRHGAVNTVGRRRGNCCDQAHAFNALSRAAGYPARYRHVRARFGNNVYGHVYSQVYVNGDWHSVDPSMRSNTYDRISAWTFVSFNANYRELPF